MPSKLTWIDDKYLYDATTTLLSMAETAKQKASANIGRNVIDPFSAIFEMSGFDMDFEEWLKAEEARQAQKTLQNFIGDFHQIVLGSCADWDNLKVGKIADLLNLKRSVIAEVKNKYNTISGGKLSDLYWSLESLVMPKASLYKRYTAYHVVIIPLQPKRFNGEFTPSDSKTGNKCPPIN
jgi:hypothetical protein